MPKTLLIGPAGSGKTRRLLDDFETTLKQSKNLLDDSFYFVLPSAEHTERIITLTLQRGIPGFFQRRITTLSTLIHQTFGIPEENVAANVTRYLTLRDVLEANSSGGYFTQAQKTNGFLKLMLSFITELKESGISAQLFRERMNGMKRLEGDLAPKYESLARIYEAYEDALRAKGLRDRQDAFTLYQQRKQEGKVRPVRFRKIWIDGFFDFSPLQLAYLRELAERTDKMMMTLTLDPEDSRADLFQIVHETKEVLTGMGFEASILPSSRNDNALSCMERHLFSAKPSKSGIAPAASIAIFEAVGMEGEIEMICRQILKMAKQGDYRLSDFAILLRTIGDYESVIRSVFSRYGIPVEIHERERLGFAPMTNVIVKMLKIFESGWKRGDLMEFLKSTYVRKIGEIDKDYNWVNRLEHESMHQGVYRDREAWLRLAPELNPLVEIEDALKSAQSFAEIKRTLVRAVRETFGILSLRGTAQAAEAISESEIASSQKTLLAMTEGKITSYARRDAASYKRFESILDEIERSFPVRHCEPGIASSLIGSPPRNDKLFNLFCERFFRLAEIDLYSIHEKNKNQVQVYDISLARQKEYKVVFVAGLLEKKFPVQMKEDPVLSDWERRLFNGVLQGDRPPDLADWRPVPMLREKLTRQALERYLFYLAVTRAKEKLFLTYPRLDLEGKESLPSYYVEEVRRLFEKELVARRQNLSRPYPALNDAVNPRELELALMGALWTPERDGVNPEPLLLYLTNELFGRETSREKFGRAFHEIKDEITDPEIVKLNPFRSDYTSPSKLEAYGKCPFHYYANYVLQLNDPEEDPNIKMRGTILHQVLEECFREWKTRPAVFEKMEHAKREAREKLAEVLKEHPILTERQYQYDLEIAQLEETLDSFFEVELDRLQTAKLHPAFFEYPFGLKGAKSPAVELEFEGRKVKICGIIDRVDVDESGKLAGVLDYKRKAEFKRDALDLGTALQLPIYTLVAERFLNYEVIAAELYSLVDAKKNGFYREEYADLVDKKKTKWTLFLDSARHRQLMEKSIGFIGKFTDGMAKVQMQARPRDKVHCERFCPYAEVCRIQKWRLPLILEEIKKEDAHQNAKVGV